MIRLQPQLKIVQALVTVNLITGRSGSDRRSFGGKGDFDRGDAHCNYATHTNYFRPDVMTVSVPTSELNF